jgi:hypothetical protein
MQSLPQLAVRPSAEFGFILRVNHIGWPNPFLYPNLSDLSLKSIRIRISHNVRFYDSEGASELDMT